MNAKSEAHSKRAVHLLAKVGVAEVVASRYGVKTGGGRSGGKGGERPSSWDDRFEGIDLIRTTGGETLKLQSSPMQSTPKLGWVIVLTGGSEQEGYSWTLYGIAPLH